MLKGVPKLLSPELLKVLCEMGHGDEIVMGDANFPADTYGARVIRADGIKGVDLLRAILTVIPLDEVASENYMLMDNGNPNNKPEIWNDYDEIVKEFEGTNMKKKMLGRFEFYDRAKKAFVIVESGEERTFANFILKKGVIK